MVCMLSNNAAAADCGRWMPPHPPTPRSLRRSDSLLLCGLHKEQLVQLVWFHFIWAEPVELQHVHVHARPCPELRALKTQASRASVPLCRHGGVLSEQIERER